MAPKGRAAKARKTCSISPGRAVCHNGDDVPIMDFAIFVPLWLSLGASCLLKHFHWYPCPFFSLGLYVVLGAASYGVIALEYRLGKPEVDRQLAEIKTRKEAEPTTEPYGGSADAPPPPVS